MAKGLRCKSALKYRNIKREAVFGPVEAARVQRLAERLKKDAEGLKTSELEAIARGEELMQVEKSKGTSPPWITPCTSPPYSPSPTTLIVLANRELT